MSASLSATGGLRGGLGRPCLLPVLGAESEPWGPQASPCDLGLLRNSSKPSFLILILFYQKILL